MTTDTTSYLAETIARIRAVNAYFTVQTEPPDGDGWVSAADLVAPESPQLAALLERRYATYPSVHRKILALNVADSYCWYLILAGLGCFLMDRRVPELKPQHVALRIDAEGNLVAVALLSERIAVLPDDAAIEVAEIEPDETALRQRLLADLRTHLAAFFVALRGQVAVPERRFWLALADYLASITVYAYGLVGRQEHAQAEAQAWLDLLWFRHHIDLCKVESGDRSQLYTFGATCCYAYQYPEGERCRLCPELPRTELVTRAAALLHEEREAHV